MPEKYYIDTSIPYANSAPHMGSALDPLYGDVLARYYRANGHDVFFLVGLDENGQKVYHKAKCEGITPEEWTENIRKKFLEFHEKLNDTPDNFIRTSDKKNHWPTAQEIWKRAEKAGDIYKKNYKGLYCVGCEEFKIERDLVDGKCPDHLTKPEEIEEENYFFKLSKYQKFLLDLFDKNKDFVYPKHKYNEAYQIIKGGLEDVSISRPKTRLPWGVPVPRDGSHVMYVWFDALTNYLSGIGFTSDKKKFEKYWPTDINIVGKDNNKWHSILWPAILKSAGLKLPKKNFIHGYVLGKGNIKMSKTIGNVVDPVEMIDKYGSDAFRYYLLAKIPVDSDGAFDEEHFREVYNSELAGGLGNLFSRTLTMIEKYCDGKIPKVKKDIDEHELRTGKDIYTWKDAYKESEGAIGNLEFMKKIESINKFIKTADKYIDDEKPWQLAKESKKEELDWILYGLADSLHQIAWMIYPFMPETSLKMAEALSIESLLKPNPQYKDSWTTLKPGTRIKKPEPLFPRLEK